MLIEVGTSGIWDCMGYNAHDTVVSSGRMCMCGVCIFLCICSEENDNCQ